MREVFVNQDHAQVGFYKSVLDDAGIPNFIRNQYANNITGMPTAVFFPALCVVNDDDYERAMHILGEIYYAPPSQASEWRCPSCTEEVPGNFDSCWKCGALRTVSTVNSDRPGNT